MAVLFSTIVFMNPVGMRLVFGERIAPRTLWAAALGVAGIVLLFLPELAGLARSPAAGLGIALGLAGTLLSSAGNMIAVRNHRRGVGVLEGTVWAMAWGAATALLIGVATGTPWAFDPRAAYWLSLAYLSVLGSIVAFGAYFTLIARVGVGVAGYTGVATPVIAVLLSTLFEGYVWSGTAALGVALAAAGNYIMLRRPAQAAGGRP